MNQFCRFIACPAVLGALIAAFVSSCGLFEYEPAAFTKVGTVIVESGKIGEPFGIAYRDNGIFVSDGAKGVIWKIDPAGTATEFASGLATPSHIAFDRDGNLIVADSGDHTIRRVATDGTVTVVAGTSKKRGFRDGPAAQALFNAPIGIAVEGEKIYVADTYNDRIRVIENGDVTTIAGETQGFRDSADGSKVKFDTPTGLDMLGGNLLVADTGNRRLRVVEPGGKTGTLAGGATGSSDGMLGSAGLRMPVGLAVDKRGLIFLADGDSVRVIGPDPVPVVRTVTGGPRGFADGGLRKSLFNRPSGLAIRPDGEVLIADSDNGLIRVLSGSESIKALSVAEFRKSRPTAEQFRAGGKPRWPFRDGAKPREIAGTLGEIRGKVGNDGDRPRFHNGLDIAGGYGEEVAVIRKEKVLRPVVVSEFGNNRENVRFPTLGYIHLRLGRSADGSVQKDERFQFRLGRQDRAVGLRIPRGSVFEAGEFLGTLNSMNHIHLIAGPSGNELNALEALGLPGVADSRKPVLEDVEILDSGWKRVETENGRVRIKPGAKLRIVAEAYDQMDGNPERRKLGLYKLGYQILDKAKEPLPGFDSPKWTIVFDLTPSDRSVGLVYASGSRSGATGETVFRYVVSNNLSGKKTSEDFVIIGQGSPNEVVIRVFAADYFGNAASKDIEIEVS